MRLSRAVSSLFSAAAVLAVCALSSNASAQSCPSNDSGLTLPAGFCATIFADGIGHVRHIEVNSNGVVYANTWSGDYYGNEKPREDPFLVALQDKTGSGKADTIERFGESVKTGGAGGTGIRIYKGWIYAENNDKILRYKLTSGSIVPQGSGETVVSGLPLGGDHPMHPFIIDSKGMMYIDVGTAGNACQLENRQPKSPGAKPCKELETRGGIWRYDANKLNQTFSPADRYATGIRNGEGFAFDASGRLFVTQHGRDQLHTNWPDLYKADEEATLPAEEVFYLKQGGDYGWPECYYDSFQQKLVLAPEYGGDGGKMVGECANKLGPAAAFPAHFAPNAMLHYDKKQFPPKYRDGMFIAFHGSWNRAPYAQNGYNVEFQPFTGEHASGQCEVFADGFAGAKKSPDTAVHRPGGLAEGPDGALYIADDNHGRIYRVTYVGGDAGGGPKFTPCPSPTAPAGDVVEAPAKPPEGTNANNGSALNLPAGVTADMIALGDKIFHGEVAGAPCAGCHGGTAKGSPLGPDLTTKKFLWSDGSVAGLAKTITDGVPQPKQYRSPMPPMGGAQLTPDQVNSVAAYVWSLSQ